jgi:E3 SUMO-protein ligase PIAS1
MVYCAADSGLKQYTKSDIAFPHQVELKANLDEVKANLRGLKNRPGTTQPADVTNYMRKKSGYTNNIVMTYALTQKVGCFFTCSALRNVVLRTYTLLLTLVAEILRTRQPCQTAPSG